MAMRYSVWSVALACLLLLAGQTATADLAVIVNAQVAANVITREEVVNIYMGRLRRFSSGEAALPVDMPSALPEKALFYRLLVNKSLSDIDAYWARLVFSGRTSPPAVVGDSAEMLERVALNPNAIGYADSLVLQQRQASDKRIKVLLHLGAEVP